ncbi:MAG TPA: TonB-dependent receptor, partial [Puia sp.]|nr:TonB-dependent receptor [Puia sp.]
IRGGVGLFAGPPPFVWISNQASNSGVALFGSISNSTNTSFSPEVNPNPNWPANASKTLSKSYSLNVTDPSFKFPQALKSSLAIDQKVLTNWIVTLEFTYAKDVNAAFFQNVNLPSTGTPLVGADNRIRYASSQIYPVGGAAAATVSNPNIGNAIYMTNVNGGYAYTATLQVQRQFRNLYVNVSYTYMQAKDVMIGGSTAATMWGSKPISGDPNAPQLGYSNSYMPQHVIASASYKFIYGKYFATSVGLIYEAAPSGVGSYVYNGDLNNDAQTSNDLLYIPTVADYQSGKYVTAGGGGLDTRTPDQVWYQINAFIQQDKYLNSRRGKYAERNAVIFPWYNRVDANVSQDFYIKAGKNTHTLRFSVDIVNVGNLINKDWGIYQLPAAGTGSSVLLSGVPNVINVGLISVKVGANGVPVYGFPYQIAPTATSAGVPYTHSWKDDTSLASRWQMQFGIRYLFN